MVGQIDYCISWNIPLQEYNREFPEHPVCPCKLSSRKISRDLIPLAQRYVPNARTIDLGR